MSVKPILFNVEMVRAILDGRKTVTRRIVKPQPEMQRFGDHEAMAFVPPAIVKGYEAVGVRHTEYLKSPYQIGAILYVRETFFKFPAGGYAYKADANSNSEKLRVEFGYRWRPSIHMPREAARIWLRVTDVRVERLQEMAEDDVVAEGAEPLIQCHNEHPVWDENGVMYGMCWNEDCCGSHCDYIEKSYGELFGEIVWDSAIKPVDRKLYGWAANPWVWVIEFERCEKPEEG